MSAARAAVAARGWPVSRAPGKVLAYFALVELVALVVGLGSLLQAGPFEWQRFLVLAAVAIGFEEFVHRGARLKIRLGPQMRVDMVSVWTVAAAVALTPSTAVGLLGLILAHAWFREWRPAGDALYRKLFVIATGLLACVGAGFAYRETSTAMHSVPTVALLCATVVAITATTVINRGLVASALMMMGAGIRDLGGTRDDNLIELATLSLGGLLGVGVVQQPWLALLVIAPMVTLQRGALMRALEAAASVDAKTGLLNAVAWEQIASSELARAGRTETTTAVVLIDLDRFKTVNDMFGHLAGDSVLRGIGKGIESAVREYDTVGRFGGEEFVAVLPDVDESAALVVAERIRARVNELTVANFVEGVDDIVPLSVSVGVACTPTDGAELSDLLHAADAALYAAKAAGRNRVRLALRGTGGSRRDAVDA